MSVIPVHGRLRQEDLEFEARPCLKKKKNIRNKNKFLYYVTVIFHFEMQFKLTPFFL
jgi:hypothetical protein